MKGFIKAICLTLSVAMLFITALSLAACEDIKKAEITVSVYDIENGKQVEKTFSVDLYRHLADDTVDALSSYAEKGYYDGLPFYKFAGSNTSQIMLGDIKLDGGAVKRQNADYVKNIDGEYKAAGVVGSDLKNEEGALGLWRTWSASGAYNKNNDAANSSGKATVYMPTSAITGYDGYFCVFGKMDLEDTDTKDAVALIKAVFGNSDYTTSYTMYYTGEYGEQGEKLVYNCILTSEYNEKLEDDAFKDSIFKAEGDQFVSFNSQEITVPLATVGGVENTVTAKIVSVKVK